MKKIMMTKYCFERWPEEDFSDDGNRFTCYRVGKRVRVSKIVSKGDAYISARIDGVKLPFEEYSKLPSYKELDRLNGIPLEDLTDEDLVRLYDACLKYEQEYTEAENSIVMPTLDEIRSHCITVCANKRNEISVAEHLIKTNISELLLHLSAYEWKTLQQYYAQLVKEVERYDEKTFPQQIVDTRRSIDFCKANAYEKKESFYYREIMEIIKSAVK